MVYLLSETFPMPVSPNPLTFSTEPARQQVVSVVLDTLPPTPGPVAPDTSPSEQAGDDSTLVSLFADGLIKSTQPGQSSFVGGQRIASVPPQSSYGKWRNHLKTLLQSNDFKRWALANRIDVSKSITLFPPRGSKAGFIAASVLPKVTANERALTANGQSTEFFGPFVANTHNIPPSWPLIMHAASILANGQTYVFSPAEGSASVNEVAAFYGESIPDDREAIIERVRTLRQSKAFAGSRETAPYDDQALQHQHHLKNELADHQVFVDQVMTQVMPQFIRLYLAKLNEAGLLDSAAESREVPEALKQPVQALLSNCLEETSMTTQAGARVSLKHFMEHQDWLMPSDHWALGNLTLSLTRATPAAAVFGNLGGAMSWSAPLSNDDLLKTYYHPVQTLPGVEDHGLFKVVTRGVHLDRSVIAHPERALEQMIDSPAGQAVGEALQRKMGALHTASSATEWLLAALQASLDQETLLDVSQTPKRTSVAGYDLAQPANVGRHPYAVVKALADELLSKQRVTADLAPVAAHLLLARRAPAYLVKNIPDTVVVGSHSWVSLEVAVSRLEARSPGAARQMTYAQVMEQADLAPVTAEDRAVEYQAQHTALKDWAVANGVIPLNADDTYTPTQMQAVRTAFNRQMQELTAASAVFSTDMPTRRGLALEELKKAFGEGIDFEKECLQSTTRAQDRNDVGPHSVVDIYLRNGTTEALARGWVSTSADVPIERLTTARRSPNMGPVFSREFAAYCTRMKAAIATQTKHLIARLPLEDRQRIEFGALVVMEQTNVSRDNFGGVQERRGPNDRSLLLKTTVGDDVLTYELNLKDNTLKRTDLGDIALGEHTDGAGRTLRRYTQVASSPAGRNLVSQARKAEDIPNSFSSSCTALIADSAVKDANIDSYETQARGATAFESRQPFYKKGRELLLSLVPLYSATKNFQAGNVADGLTDLALDALGLLVVVGAAAKGGKVVSTGARSLSTLGQASRAFGRTALSAVNPLDGLGSSVLRGGRQVGISVGNVRGIANQYDLMHASRNYGVAAQGTYTVGEHAVETSAILRNGKWYGYNPASGSAYGKALSVFNAKSVAMGGEMQNFRVINNGLGMSEDTTKRGLRLTLDAHGAMPPGHSSALMQVNGDHITPGQLLEQLKAANVDMTKYREIRLTMCHSGNGAEHSFAAQLSKLTQKPTEGFVGIMHTSPELQDVAARMFKNGGAKQREFIAETVNGRRKTIDKLKETGITPDNRHILTPHPDYNPVRFTAEGKMMSSKPLRSPQVGDIRQSAQPVSGDGARAPIDLSEYDDLT